MKHKLLKDELYTYTLYFFLYVLHSLFLLSWEVNVGTYLFGFVIYYFYLTHWGRATHICVSKLANISSDNGLSPGRCQAIIWTNVGILSFEPLGTNFSEILIGMETFSLKKMRWKLSSGKWRPFCLGLNVLIKYKRMGTFFNSLRPSDAYILQ